MGLDVGRYSEALVGGSAIEYWILISRTVSEHCTPQVRTLDCTFTNKNESRLITTYTTTQFVGYVADYQQCTWLLLSKLS